MINHGNHYLHMGRLMKIIIYMEIIFTWKLLFTYGQALVGLHTAGYGELAQLVCAQGGFGNKGIDAAVYLRAELR
jgi:hypothetical protein